MVGITKRFGALVANDQIHLSLHCGEILAILGENGAGKTTLMNILFGHYLPDQGQVRVFGQPLKLGSPAAALAAGIGMVHQHVVLADNLSVLDNILLGTEPLWQLWSRRQQGRRRIQELATELGLEIDPDAWVGSLALGQRQRVEILKVLYRGVRILILDEPTAVLTPAEIEPFFQTLRRMVSRGLGILLISHKLQEVMQISDRVVVLRAGRVVTEVKTSKTDPAALAEAMVGERVAPVVKDLLPAGEPVLVLQQVSCRAGQEHLDQVSLTVHRHEIVGIAGVAGNGQTALADLVCGLLRPHQGEIHLRGQVLRVSSPALMVQQGMARIPEDRHKTGLIGSLTLWENWVAERYRDPEFCCWGFLRHRQIYRQAQTWLQAFDVRSPGDPRQGLQMPVQVLSGGNMQKVILSRVLCRDPQVIVAHQPTRGLDLGAVAYVHKQLLAAAQRGAGILLISEDLDELLSLADRVAVLYRGQLSAATPTQETTLTALGLRMAGQEIAYAS
ncbi:MAG: ABC transporter ATP-binding protein [Thermostichus sp. DG02_5_bins_236]